MAVVSVPKLQQVEREPAVEKMPGHWVLARLGKRVLRPGGLELTRQMLSELAIDGGDDVVEFAPGMGVTARMTLARRPGSYTAVERDVRAQATVARYLRGPRQRCLLGSAEDTGLPPASATVVYGEAMLSMQPVSARERIVREAARLLVPGGRYGIHELCVVPDDLDVETRAAIQHELSQRIHVGVRPLTAVEWRELLGSAGLTVVAERRAAMHLLEPLRMMRDEGLWRMARIAWNLCHDRAARARMCAMRSIFRKYRQHLAGITLVGEKRCA